jgi:3-oxoacyl-[acyl-carrier-protein] synthase III
MIRTVIQGAGHYVPPKVVTNDDLSKMMTTTDEWIVQRSGIKERHYVEDGVGAADLGREASKIALANAGIAATDLDAIVFATLTPDLTFPGSGCLLQQMLGCKQIPAYDLRNQCSGFIYGLQMADSLIKTGVYKKVLLVGAEVHSTGLEFNDRGRDVTVLFGDGAGAVVLGAAEGKGDISDRGVHFTKIASDGVGARELWVEAPCSNRIPRVTPAMLEEGRHYPRMNGKLVFKWATEKMPEIAADALTATGVSVNDLAWFVPHQANLRINELVARRLSIPDEKCWNNIVRYGNTTAATIPMGLSELMNEKKTKAGDLILMAAFGAGFTWGSAIVRM